jgi:hypothetical protein
MTDPKPRKPSKGMPEQAPIVDVADLVRENRPPPIKQFDNSTHGFPRLGSPPKR